MDTHQGEIQATETIDDLYVWGDIGARDDKGLLAAPVRIPFPFPSPVQSIACGTDFTLILLQNNTLLGFGNTFFGQLGIALDFNEVSLRTKFAAVSSPTPINAVPPGEYVRAIAAGESHAVLLSSSGKVYSAGSNMHFQLGHKKSLKFYDPKERSVSPVGKHSASVVPFQTKFEEVAGIPDMVCSIAVGKWNSYAVTVTGDVFSWGTASPGALGHPTGDKVEFCKNEEKTFINREGESLCTVMKPRRIDSLHEKRVHVQKVVSGTDHALFLTETKEIFSTGCGRYGRLGTCRSDAVSMPSEPINENLPERKYPEHVVDVFAGSEASFVIRRSAELGCNVYTFGLIADHSGVETPTIIPEICGAEITGIASCGSNHVAWTQSGEVYVWGKNPYCSSSGIVNFYAKRDAASKPMKCALFKGKETVMAACSKKAVFVITRETLSEEPRDIGPITPARDIVQPFVQILHAERNLDAQNLALAKHIMKLPENADSYRIDILGPDLGETYNALFRKLVEDRYAQDIELAQNAETKDAYLSRVGKEKLGARSLEQGKKIKVWMENVYALGIVLSKISETPINGKRTSRFRVRWLREDWVDEEIDLNSDDEITCEEDRSLNPARWMHGWVQSSNSVKPLY